MGLLDKILGKTSGAPSKEVTAAPTAAPVTKAPEPVKQEVAPKKSEEVKVSKPKLAYVHLSGCTGCLISLSDNYEKLLDVLGAVDQVYNLTLMDQRELPEGKIDIALVEGAVCLQDEHSVHLIKETREKAGLVIAYGGCAATGCVTNFCRGGQANQPQHESFVPINRVIKVDAYIPGCPPTPEIIYNVAIAAVTGDMEYLQPFLADKGGYACGCDLFTKIVENGLCIGCGTCASSCPTRALEMQFGRPSLNNTRCVKCGACSAACPRSFLPVSQIEKKLMV
ncbi:coenzyme F420 hydrogenase subunit gamma [Methanocella sp. CWC-04]|uniref:Coenzyme F420 hydrogenase subunit gamma n=1 Tax=Methanooceanicella nereidis TaxID=2052831 RepID=A0AAP2RAK2_9EURY|nr:coenzyme F420 hydrogenase subunit gamma [Methanocella sp. CWC-04]MCD1293793.1 coenzyme F420 hydrogenase subunit gamma [Methanocella sp. CWC-04]